MKREAQEKAPILPAINSPSDLWDLDTRQLEQLAGELRETILEVVSRNGGHLASNLGAVELTLALHHVFRMPRDKIIWDVGHQAYTHKLITGRRNRFSTLRTKGGISGFPKRKESPYDIFDVGHSGTSISAALGIAEGMKHQGEEGKVVAVIGDGSMTAGLALEGLNQGGALGERLVVVLNDNEMSIAPNVGAMSSYLSRTLTGSPVGRVKKVTENFLKSIPKVGEHFLHIAQRHHFLIKYDDDLGDLGLLLAIRLDHGYRQSNVAGLFDIERSVVQELEAV